MAQVMTRGIVISK